MSIRPLIFLPLVILTACVSPSPTNPRAKAPPLYNPDVSTWHEDVVPRARHGPRYFSPYVVWRVYRNNGRVQAELTSERTVWPRPPFRARVRGLGEGDDFARVEDGWLVAFYVGHGAGELRWFSPDGRRNYQISGNKMRNFLPQKDGLYAIEGCTSFEPSNIAESSGALLRMVRNPATGRWEATTYVKLPEAPAAPARRADGTWIIPLRHNVVTVDSKHRIRTFLNNSGLGEIDPTSSVLTPDERRFYIGGRQYVVELDLQTRRLRFLTPNRRFLHEFFKGDE